MRFIIEKISSSLYTDNNFCKEYSKIYKIHKYWARKPWYIVERYINDYSKPGDLVMDPFCGSGCTGLEAVINGRSFLGQDLNPSAIQVSRGTLMNQISFDLLKKSYEVIRLHCFEKIMSLYVSDQMCPTCGKPLYFRYLNIGPKFQRCFSGALYCSCCAHKVLKHELTSEEYSRLEELQHIDIDNWYPSIEFPKKFFKDRFSYKGIHSVSDMFTRRNLYALSLLYKEIQKIDDENKELLMLAFTNTVLHVSKLKGENVRPLGVNNYWVPDDYIEENVWFRFEDRINNLIKAKEQQKIREQEKRSKGLNYGKWTISLKSSLEDMGSECVDYFFTDPPYGDAIQYSELSYMWNAWLDKEYNIIDEVIVNPVQNKGNKEFQELLNLSLDNIYRALKTGGYLTLCFQNKNSEIWKRVVMHCKNVGLKLVDISIYDTFGSPYNKSWANFSPKSDIYVTFKKEEADNNEYYDEYETVESISKEIAVYMEDEKISTDNNRLYDLTISYLIWALYYNKRSVDISSFNIKKFAQIASRALGLEEG